MFEHIDLNKKLSKEAYKLQIVQLEEKLASLQQKIKELKIPVVIVTEGWSSSGKGSAISKILNPLDPRYFNVYSMRRRYENPSMRPFLWAFWIRLPQKGRITLFDRSWCRGLLPDANTITAWKLTETESKHYYDDVNAFEQQLSDDGMVIIKFFLHISQNEQRKRFKELEKNASTRWRIDEKDWEQNSHYEDYLTCFKSMIQNTDKGSNLWTIVEAEDHRFAAIKMLNVIIERLEAKIAEQKTDTLREHTQKTQQISILSSIDLGQTISEDDYRKQLKVYQRKISDLAYKLYDRRRAVVIVYEGWDASGKGGNIKRIVQEVDPRGYEVVPIGVPTEEELSHHYLWRFYRKLPKDGHIAIFDRSWYGRILVERVEGFCTATEWMRAYKEINDMERHCINHGIIILKFWMHIDADEQLRRFKAREQNLLKQYKITEEDWRNREKWELYEEATNEMLFRTSTHNAPWIIVESNCKKYARIKTLKILTNELEHQLK